MRPSCLVRRRGVPGRGRRRRQGCKPRGDGGRRPERPARVRRSGRAMAIVPSTLRRLRASPSALDCGGAQSARARGGRPAEARIAEAYARLGRGRVAVRSSARAEDSEEASFAGQQETFLDVEGADEVCDRVVDCWASFFSERALFYRSQKGSLRRSRDGRGRADDGRRREIRRSVHRRPGRAAARPVLDRGCPTGWESRSSPARSRRTTTSPIERAR